MSSIDPFDIVGRRSDTTSNGWKIKVFNSWFNEGENVYK